jgi:hypothetical protein
VIQESEIREEWEPARIVQVREVKRLACLTKKKEGVKKKLRSELSSKEKREEDPRMMNG